MATALHSVLWIVASFIVSVATLAIVRHAAHRYGWLAQPRADRWHQRPTALHGGMGIATAFFPLVGIALSVLQPIPDFAWSLFVGSGAMVVLGWLDDLYHFHPATKLIGQLVASSLLIGQGLVIHIGPWYPLNVVITYLWFIGIINAVNMLDNIDGLAGGVVAIAASVLWCIFMLGGGAPSFAGAWLGVFIGVLLGFLCYNFHPASIFMGDSGSLFLGYALAAMAIPSPLNEYWFVYPLRASPWNFLFLLGPAMLLAVPIFDTTLVTVTRTWYGRRASQGGRDHSSHRLVGLGLSERRAVLMLYGVALLGGAASLCTTLHREYLWLVFPLFVVFLAAFGAYLGQLKVYDGQPPTTAWTPLVTELFHKRRFFEVLSDFIMVGIAYEWSFFILYEGDSHLYGPFRQATLVVVIVGMVLVFWWCGLYRGIWRFMSLGDLGRYIRGAVVGAVLFSVLREISRRTLHLPWAQLPGHYYGLPLVFALLTFLLIVGVRLSFRYFDNVFTRRGWHGGDRTVIIYGAGHGGKIALEELRRNAAYRATYRLVCFVDDDLAKHNRLMDGVPVVHPTMLKLSHGIDEIWISTAKVSIAGVFAESPDRFGTPIVKRIEVVLHEVNRVDVSRTSGQLRRLS